MRGLSALVLSAATFCGVTSADAQIVIDGHFADWDGINAATVDDAKDMADSSGDIRQIQAHVEGGNLHLSMSVHGIAAPSVDDTPEGMKNRYYYHWLMDTDNDTATGFKNDAYEGNPTGLAKPIGVDLVVQFGWRDGKPNGLAAYDPLVGDDSPLVVDFAFNISGDTISAVIPLSDLKLTEGQSVGFSAFQEGASDGWSVDWVESASVTLSGPVSPAASVNDPKDMADSSGDIKNIKAVVKGDNLHLSMSVHGAAAPSVDDTPEGMKNRYYYHWLFDTDNDTATGFKNDAYEGNPTGLAKPIGVDLVVQFGWRDGKPNGLAAYDPLVGDDSPLVVDFAFNVSGDTINAVIPLADLKLTAGQSVGFSAFQEGASDGWSVDWVESDTLTLVSAGLAGLAEVTDPKDMADSSGDIRNIQAIVQGSNLFLRMTVDGLAAPSVDDTPEGMKNRYYYHWLLDTDNDTATGFKNDAYEGNPTGLAKPIGVDLVVMIGWRDGKPNGIAAYDPLVGDDSPLVVDFTFATGGNSVEASIPLADLGLTPGQAVGFSAFQEGASDGWSVDWVESAPLTLKEIGGGRMAIDGNFDDWIAPVAEGDSVSVDDPKDMADSSGDIKNISAHVEGDNLHLSMSVYGIAAPSVDDTPEGMKNRYYYHWLMDTDNDTATGFKNDAYEGSPTGLAKPIGVDLVVQFGWRDGKPNGLAAYDPLVGDDSPLVVDYTFATGGDSVEAVIPLSDLGLTLGQSVGFSAFQEGASDGWSVDWVESTVVTLSQDTKVDMTLETLFAGSAYGFEIQVMDDGDTKVDAASVSVSVDGASVEASVAQANGVTLITGQNPALLPEETAHTVSLTLDAGGAAQSKDFVFIVGKYTHLPEALNLGSAKKESGFLVGVTQISSATTLLPSLHENKAELAEKQLAGKMLDPDYEDEEVPYVNEAHEDAEEEFVVVYDTPDVINWFEQAPGEAGNFRAGLGFEDELFPFLPGWNEVHDGVVIEIRAYLDLEAGSHKIGMNGEGGWKVSGGTDASGILVGVYDNSEIEQVPTYYPLDQYVDIVVTKAGLYPIRVLWFQSSHNKAPGMQLELFTVKDRAKHLLNDPNDPLAIKAYRAGDLLPFVVPEGMESAGLTRVVNDKIIFETDTANQNNWEPFSSVIGNSTFVVEANSFADPEEDYNQRYVLAFQPVGGGEAKMGEVFHGDDGSPYTGKINGSRQNGNPGRVAGDPRPGSVNFIAGGEASPHMFGEFQSDNRWDLGVDRLADGRYGAVQTYSLDPETLEQTPLSNAIDAINGRLTEGSPPGNQVGRFGGDMVPLSNGNFAVVVEDRSGFHTDGTAATAVIIAPNGSIVRESFVIESGSIWSNVASFKGGWAARVGGVIYFFDNAGDLVGESEQADSGVSFDGGRGDGTRIYGHINSPYLFMAGPGDGRVQLAVWDSRDQSFVTSIPVSEADYKASFERVNLASDALNRVVVAYESKPTAEGKEYEQHQVTVRVMSFDAANGTFSHLTPSFFAFTNQAASGIRTVRPTVAMTTKEICIAAKGEINRANKPEDGPDTEPQTTFYTVFSHPDPQEDPTPALVPPIYPAPDGGWAYSLDTSMAKAGEDGSGFTSLDGTWSHDNGSDQWDGSAIGGDFGDGNRPGGVNALDGFIRLQETGDPRDYGYSDSGSNRKLYFGKDITELGVSDTILDDGVTLHFKIRVPTDGPLDQLHPDGGGGVTDYPASGDTYKLHDGEKGHIGIYQGAGGLISFTLTDGGLMIREDGSEILGLDPTTWHEFWVTIEADNVGAGTHKVSVYVDGLSPEVFSINKGGGKDFNIISYLAIGLGATPDSGALDVAAFDFAAGVKVPVAGEPAPAEPPTLSIVDNGNGSVTVTFEGKLQAAASVNGPWADVAGATSPLTISADEAQQYARAVGE